MSLHLLCIAKIKNMLIGFTQICLNVHSHGATATAFLLLYKWVVLEQVDS